MKYYPRKTYKDNFNKAQAQFENDIPEEPYDKEKEYEKEILAEFEWNNK